jgi:hypothetical protein
MAYEHAIAGYRKLYSKLLRFYPHSYRERFGEGMEQTFNDLCRERLKAERGLFNFALWMFLETSAGVFRENVRSTTMPLTKIIRVLLVAAGLLIVPLTASFFVDGWNWGVGGYVFAWVMFASAGLGFTFLASMGDTMAYKVAVGLACATGFILLWINAAAGIIGDGPVNLLYLGVLAVGFVGALIAHFHSRGMALALLATAIAQMFVPVIALMIWKAGWQDLLIDPNSPHPPFHPGIAPVFGLNAVFAMLWIGSAWLFLRAARKATS